METKTEKYYIAYFDILGYRNFFDDKDNDINEFLNYNIGIVNDTIARTRRNSIIFNYSFELKMFSDNFVILVKDSESIPEYSVVKQLAFMLAYLQLRFLERYKILIRGVITKGDVYIDEKFIFGEGIIRAVEEEEYANFPRIIIDKERISDDACKKLYEEYVAKDEDDEYYINFWQIIETGAVFDNNNIRCTEDYLDLIKNNIILLVKKYGRYNRNMKDKKKIQIAEKTISKYAWLLYKFNMYCEDEYPEWKIPYALTLYYKLMKSEINITKVNK